MGLTIGHWVLEDEKGENRMGDPFIPDTKKGSQTLETEATQLRRGKVSHPSSQTKKVPYSLPTPLGSGSKLTFPRQDANGISPVVVGTLKGFHLLISQVLRIVKGPGFLRGKTVNVPLLCQAAGLICMAVAISF